MSEFSYHAIAKTYVYSHIMCKPHIGSQDDNTFDNYVVFVEVPLYYGTMNIDTLEAFSWIISVFIAATVANPPSTCSQQYYQEICATSLFVCSVIALHDALL